MKKTLLSLAILLVSAITASATGHTVAIPVSNNITCNGMCNGSATALASGGVGPYGYIWAGPSSYTATGANISGLCVGTYTVTAIDSSDLSTATAMISITQPAALVNTIIPPGVGCPGTCGPLNAINSGGTPPYTYMWTPTGGLSNPTDPTPIACLFFTTTYTLVTTDAYGCIATTSNTIPMPPPIMATIATTPTPCGTCNGSIVATVSGGYPPYAYNWNGPSGFVTTVASPIGLCAGSYTVSITDAGGCNMMQYATIGTTGGPTLVLDSITNINCSGAAFGSISIHATGGSGGPYTYYWLPGGQTTASVTGLPAGSYSVTVDDGTGCSNSGTYTVLNGTSIYPNLTTTYANCAGNGSATATVIGGVPPYTFQWNDASNQTTPTATNLTGGVYTVVITDSTGCDVSGSTNVGAFCSNVVRGRVYRDLNSNCVQDSGELGIAGVTITGSAGYAYTDLNGDYILYTNNMSPTLSVAAGYLTSSGYTPTCPATGVLNPTFTTLGDTSYANNFGYYQDPSYFNLVIHPGWSSASPGFQKTYWICYYNNSPTPQNALIRFVYDSTLQFVSATMGGVHYPAQHKIEWTYTALAPATMWDWAARPIITFNVPATASISDSLQSYFEILPMIGDSYPTDNTLSSNEPITGSHDPNSKAVMPKGVGPYGNISVNDSVLMYTIHFQNNGNDTAHTVVVTDTLSSYLDPATVVPGASDHPYTFDLSFNGVMTFKFDNIMLPDSTHDEPGSNGYFNYTVKVRPGLPFGTVIQNTADIFFDFNSAIVTNTVTNTLTDFSMGIETTSTNNAIKVYPNPFTDNTTFVIESTNNEVYSFELTDVLGKKVKSLSGISEKQFQISRNGLENGIYFYKIYSSGSLVGVGKVVVK